MSMKKFILFLLFAFPLLLHAQQPKAVSPHTMAKRLGFGWNLGNHFDSHAGGRPVQSYWDRAVPTEQLYRSLYEAGVRTVRIPITWGPYAATAPDYAIDPRFMAEVEQNVDWAERAHLNVIINLHHDEYWLDVKGAAADSTLNDAIRQRIAAIWRQIAEHFADRGDFLIFESFNEVQDGKWGWGDNRTDGGRQYAVLNGWNQLFVDVVRSTGGHNPQRWLAVPGYASNPELTVEHLVMPKDPTKGRIIVPVHFYAPTDFSLENKTELWGVDVAEGDGRAKEDVAKVEQSLLSVRKRFVDAGIPVYVGEMGCSRHATPEGEASRARFLEVVCRTAFRYDMPPVIWDNNITHAGRESHGYFDHTDGHVVPASADVLRLMIGLSGVKVKN